PKNLPESGVPLRPDRQMQLRLPLACAALVTLAAYSALQPAPAPAGRPVFVQEPADVVLEPEEEVAAPECPEEVAETQEPPATVVEDLSRLLQFGLANARAGEYKRCLLACDTL